MNIDEEEGEKPLDPPLYARMEHRLSWLRVLLSVALLALLALLIGLLT